MPKQLSLSERIIIERMISKDYSFASIGRNLERSASTISREVIKYRCFVDRIPLPGENDCTHKNSCLKNSICDDVGVHGCYGYRCKRCPEDRICTNICASYESSQCPLLDKPPYVCTNCSMLKQCKRNKAYYTAHRADAAHHKSIRNAHSGVRKTPSELRAIADIIEILGVSLFKRLFPVILTDNGVEFKNPQALEHTRTGLSRTRVFFCDPQASWQKPQVENNHRFIRRILPKGVSFSPLTVADVTLICCHINSVLRENLDNKTPFDLMDSKGGKKLLSLLQLSPIPPDEVTLSPKLLKR